jgi:hypothetical protein
MKEQTPEAGWPVWANTPGKRERNQRSWAAHNERVRRASQDTHKHTAHGPCRTVCGLPCDKAGDVSYSGDGKTVTCPGCAS